jgi:diadenosine tetraphosphate (Ap4A) HIT family hydrolase
MANPYDPNNVFARVLRGELPCKKVYENDHVLAFEDIRPLLPTHVLVIPKGAYVTMDDFTAQASGEEIAALFRAVGTVARLRGVDAGGYRVIINSGANGHQEVPHLHVHVLGGRPVGRMVGRMVGVPTQ